jgi:TatD DNase family protein
LISIEPVDWQDLLILRSQLVSELNQPWIVGWGIHPWFVHKYRDTWPSYLATMESQLQLDRQLAIGEIGLDFDKRTPADKALQIAVFTAQLELAQAYQRPVSIHLRRCFPEAEKILCAFTTLKGFLHGFSGGVDWAKRLLSCADFLIGINGVVCREHAPRYHQLVQSLSLEYLALETDGPFGSLPGTQQFECRDLDRVGHCVALLTGRPIDELSYQTRTNCMRILSHVVY